MRLFTGLLQIQSIRFLHLIFVVLLLGMMDIDLVILQSRSPSCGVKQIYDGSFSGRLIDGRGLFAQALLENGYKVVDVEDIEKIQK